jgi:membrane protease YdiL (CAAX protease family)
LSEETVISIEPNEEKLSVPWSLRDTWLGLGIFVILTVGILGFVGFVRNTRFIQNIGLIILELLYLVPVIVILAWRRVSWKALGFQSFNRIFLGLGCALLIGAYMIIIAHNLIMSQLGFLTQGEQIFQFFSELENPLALLIVGVVLAPIVEEVFFRGFLFNGFRQHFGWNKAALLSAFIFSLAHLQLVTLIPTFILGYLLAFMFHKSNSLWPGIILHFLVNTFGFCMIYVVSQIPI